MQQTARPAPGFARNPKKIDIVPYQGTVTVKAGDAIVATTRQAKRLDEEGLPPVLYIPFEDVRFANLERTETRTHCPYKGDASYWRLVAASEPQDIMWAYEDPYDEMQAIKDHGAFYEDRVNIEEGKA